MELIAGGGVSILCSLLLWFFLPRGVVLTSTELPYVKEGCGGMWQVKNESPLPVRILKVALYGPAFIDEATEKLIEVDVTDSYDEHLMLDTEGDTCWRGHIVQPGDTFSASVGGNTDLRIRYRRAGWSGVLERRLLVIFGGV